MLITYYSDFSSNLNKALLKFLVIILVCKWISFFAQCRLPRKSRKWGVLWISPLPLATVKTLHTNVRLHPIRNSKQLSWNDLNQTKSKVYSIQWNNSCVTYWWPFIWCWITGLNPQDYKHWQSFKICFS